MIFVLKKTLLCNIWGQPFSVPQIANANNCVAFGDYMKEMRKRYIKQDYAEEGEDDDSDTIRRDPFQQLTDRFNHLAKEWSVSDPPENCHLNVKKLPKTFLFFY